MNSEKGTTSVYSVWMQELLSRYIRILDLVIDKVQRLPRFPDNITEVDKNNLIIAMKAVNLNPEKYGDLDDVQNFMRALGDVYNRALEKVEKWLRPSDPIIEKLEHMNDVEKEDLENIMEVGEGEL